jgi:hypothetical protein
LTPSLKQPRLSSRKKKTVKSGDAFEDTRFKPTVRDFQIMTQVTVESQLFTSLGNICHQWLSDVNLVQVITFSASYSNIELCFTAEKRIVGVGILSRNFWMTPQNGRVHI